MTYPLFIHANACDVVNEFSLMNVSILSLVLQSSSSSFASLASFNLAVIRVIAVVIAEHVFDDADLELCLLLL